MSRTYRKYPTLYWKVNGEYYSKHQDIPRIPWWVEAWHREQRPEWVTVYREYIPWDGAFPIPYKKQIRILKSVCVDDGVKLGTREIDADLVIRYDEKSTEGRRHNNRSWHSHGVGKAWKQIRNRKHRSQCKNAIRTHHMKGNLDGLIPNHKNTDRWDYY